MQLVMKTDYGWEGQGVIVHDTHRGSGNKTYKWEVEDVRVPGP